MSFCLFLHGAKAQAGTIIGSWDLSRGGIDGFAESPGQAGFRSLVQTTFPGTSFVGSSTLNAPFLNGINVLILGSAFSNTNAVTPLSAAEQLALHDFVLAGGNAIIATDNANQSINPVADLTYKSFLDPFGLDTTGDLFASGPVPVVGVFLSVSHPIIQGPFGTVTTWWMDRPGYYDSLGPSAQALAIDPLSNPVIAVIDRGVLGLGSGSVVFLSDLNILDPSLVGNNLPAAKNILDFSMAQAPPTPPLLTIASAGSNTVNVSWPYPALGFVLQRNSDLTMTNWVNVTNAVSNVSGQNQVLIPSPAGNCFFRLRHP